MLKSLLLVICLFALTLASTAQRVVTGLVTSSDGGPVSGASVMIRGTKAGTTTDDNGKFSLSVGADDSVLVISHSSFVSRTVNIANKLTVTAELKSVQSQMDEVVVIGYGTQRKSDLTGALGRVNSEELNRNKTTDVLSALQGKMAGVQIGSQSGELGSGFNVKVRGASSINGSSSPLYVIDGVPMDYNPGETANSSLVASTTPDPLAGLNPADIESIEVLKDASATAIYGSRGSNGVVLITTKSGKVGRSTVDYDGNLRFGWLSKKLAVLNAQEFHDYRVIKAGAADPVAVAMDTNGDGIVDVPYHDYQDEIYTGSLSQSHTLSVSAGNKTTQFSGGVNYLHDQGLISVNTNDRYGARLRVDHNLNDKFKVGINLNTSVTTLNGATNSGGAFAGVARRVLFSRPVDIYSASDASDGYEEYVSPFIDIDEAFKNVTTTRTIGNVNLAYKITKDLSFSTLMGGTLSDSKGREFYNSKTTGGVKANGAGYVNNIHSYNWTNTNQFTYQRRLKNNSNLNVVAAFELSSYGFESNSMSAENFTYQGTGIDDITKAGSITGVNTYRYKNNRVSYLARVNYSLLNKYLFTVSGRADGSDKFGSNNKYGFFPSGAFAWKFTEEKFMQNLSAISSGKLRVSYGITGNERIAPFAYLPLLENSYYASNGTAQLGLTASNPGNPDLKWEESRQFNAGLDLGFMNERLQFTVDYYNRQVRNMLIKAQLPSQTGYTYQWKNLGRVDNQGLEFSLSSKIINKKSFSWTADVNLTYNTSIIKSLGGASDYPITVPGEITQLGRLIVGQPFGTGYGYIKDGVYQLTDFTWQNNSDPSIAPAQRTYVLKSGVPPVSGVTVLPGSYKFRDFSGPKGVPDGIVDSYDQTVISYSQPKFIGGFNTSISYHNFDFALFLQGVAGRDILNTIKLDMTGWKANRNQGSDFFYNRWTETNPTNGYGTWGDVNATALLPSTFYVEDGSYLRVKSITLAYNVPKSVFKNKINRLRVYATANDLFTFTNYSGYDPDVQYKNDLLTGVDNLVFPRSKTFILGLTASF